MVAHVPWGLLCVFPTHLNAAGCVARIPVQKSCRHAGPSQTGVRALYVINSHVCDKLHAVQCAHRASRASATPMKLDYDTDVFCPTTRRHIRIVRDFQESLDSGCRGSACSCLDAREDTGRRCARFGDRLSSLPPGKSDYAKRCAGPLARCLAASLQGITAWFQHDVCCSSVLAV